MTDDSLTDKIKRTSSKLIDSSMGATYGALGGIGASSYFFGKGVADSYESATNKLAAASSEIGPVKGWFMEKFYGFLSYANQDKIAAARTIENGVFDQVQDISMTFADSGLMLATAGFTALACKLYNDSKNEWNLVQPKKKKSSLFDGVKETAAKVIVGPAVYGALSLSHLAAEYTGLIPQAKEFTEKYGMKFAEAYKEGLVDNMDLMAYSAMAGYGLHLAGKGLNKVSEKVLSKKKKPRKRNKCKA